MAYDVERKTNLQETGFWHGQVWVESVRVKIACDAKYDGKEDEVDTEIAIWSQLDSPITNIEKYQAWKPSYKNMNKFLTGIGLLPKNS